MPAAFCRSFCSRSRRSVWRAAELLERLLKLAREALAVNAKGGDGQDHELGTRGFVEQLSFEQRDAVMTPGDVGDLVEELGLGGRGGAEFVEELLDVAMEGGQVLSGEDGILGVKPCLIALSFARCLPASVRGPVECWAFARLICAREIEAAAVDAMVDTSTLE